MAERQIPGGAFLIETGTAQRQIPGSAFAMETLTTAQTYTSTAEDSFALTDEALTDVVRWAEGGGPGIERWTDLRIGPVP